MKFCSKIFLHGSSSVCTRVKCSQVIAISDKLFHIFVLKHSMTATHFACYGVYAHVYMYDGMLTCVYLHTHSNMQSFNLCEIAHD